MNRLALTTLLLAALAQSAGAASVFRCTVNGRTVFQQSACANDETPARADAASAPSAPAASAPARKGVKTPTPPAPPSAPASTPAKSAKPG